MTMTSRDTGAVVTVVNGEDNPIPVVFAGMATESDLLAHIADSTNVHGISDTADLVYQADLEAANIAYDNTDSGLTATDVQAAIDEHITAVSDTHQATQIGYDNATSGLSATDVQAAIDEDAGDLADHVGESSGAHDASAIGYDNMASGLTATDAQAAIDEVVSNLGDHIDATTDVHGIADTSALAVISSQALIDAATIVWDVADGAFATLTIAGNRTLANPTNLVAGAAYALKVTQGAGGSHTLAYDTAYLWSGGSAPTLSTAAGAIDILTFIGDGTSLYGAIQKGFA